MNDTQPGQVIVPHEPDEAPGDGAPKPERPDERPESAPNPGPAPEPEASDRAVASTAASGPPLQADTEAAGWQFRQEPAESAAGMTPVGPPQDVSWTASEFIAHEKSAGWYALLVLGGLAATAVVYLLTKDKISTSVVLLAAIAFGFFAARKPRTQQYSLTGRGLQIGQKFYGFQDFKTFSVSEEGAIASIVFAPMKRFMPPLTIYVAPDIENSVVDFLSAYLPLEEHKADAVDSLLKRMRF